MASILQATNTTTTLLPTSSFAAPNTLFGNADRNDGSIYGWATTTSTITLPASDLADGYLFLWGFEFEDTSNGRHNPVGKMVQASGTGNFVSAQTSGFNRDTSEDRSYVSGWSFVDGPSASSTYQFQWKRDADTPTGGTVRAFIQAIPFYYADIGLYTSTTAANYGGTTPNLVTGFTGTDGTNVTISSDQISMTGDNKRYLCLASGYMENASGGTRTQRWWGMEVDGAYDYSAQGCSYIRNSSNDFGGESFIKMLETVTATRTLELNCFRGDGVLANEGGADVDGGGTENNAAHAMVVIELNDDAEVYQSVDGTGGQEFALTGPVDVNIARTGDIEFSDAASFARASDIAVNCEVAMDVFAFANVSHARGSGSIGSGSRWTVHGEFTVDGVEDTSVGFHGNYNRGNQSTSDCHGSSTNQAGVFAMALDEDIGVSNQELAGSEGGSGDIETNADWVSFGLINIDTLEAAAAGTIFEKTLQDLDSVPIDYSLDTLRKFNVEIFNNVTALTDAATATYVEAGAVIHFKTLQDLDSIAATDPTDKAERLRDRETLDTAALDYALDTLRLRSLKILNNVTELTDAAVASISKAPILVTKTDEFDVTDAVSLMRFRDRVLADAVELIDAALTERSMERLLTDDFGVVDSALKRIIRQRLLSDATTIVDNIVYFQVRGRLLTDAADLFSFNFMLRDRYRALFSAAEVTDTVTAISLTDRLLADDITLADFLTMRFELYRVVSDSMEVVDDAIASILRAGGVNVKTLSDEFDVDDVISMLRYRERLIQDSAAFADTALAQKHANRVLTEEFFRENHCKFSEEIDTGWTIQPGVVVTLNAAADPDGNMTADKVDWSGAPTFDGVFQSASVTGNEKIGEDVTRSCYIRADVGGGTCELTDPNFTVLKELINLTTEWQRVDQTEVIASGNGSAGIWIRSRADSPAHVYVAWSQVEMSSNVTDYIGPTGATSVKEYLRDDAIPLRERNRTKLDSIAGQQNWIRNSDDDVSGYGSTDVTDAGTPIAGFANSVQFDDPVGAWSRAYNAGGTLGNYFPEPDPHILCFSTYIEMDDGSQPNPGTTSVAFDFRYTIDGFFKATDDDYSMENVFANVWRVWAYHEGGTGAIGTTGIYKWGSQSTKGFRTTGWQLEVVGSIDQRPSAYLENLTGNGPIYGDAGVQDTAIQLRQRFRTLIDYGSRRNKFDSVDDLTAGEWSLSQATMSLSAHAPPAGLGLTQAWDLKTVATSTQHRLIYSQTFPTTVPQPLGTDEVIAFYMRVTAGSSYDKMMFQIPADGNHQRLGFDLTNGVQFGQSSPSYDSYTVNYIDGIWWRIEVVTNSRGVGLSQDYVNIIIDDDTPGNSGIFLGDGTGITIAGPSLEDGDKATALIVNPAGVPTPTIDLQVTDASTVLRQRPKEIQDLIDAADNIIELRQRFRQMDEPISLVDAFIKTITGQGGVINSEVLQEFLALTDDQLRGLGRTRLDILAITDATIRYLLKGLVLSDTISVTDVVLRRILGPLQLSFVKHGVSILDIDLDVERFPIKTGIRKET